MEKGQIDLAFVDAAVSGLCPGDVEMTLEDLSLPDQVAVASTAFFLVVFPVAMADRLVEEDLAETIVVTRVERSVEIVEAGAVCFAEDGFYAGTEINDYECCSTGFTVGRKI